jgi:hypothetical protein
MASLDYRQLCSYESEAPALESAGAVAEKPNCGANAAKGVDPLSQIGPNASVFDLVAGPERGVLDEWFAGMLGQQDRSLSADINDISHGRMPKELIATIAATQSEGGAAGKGPWGTRLQIVQYAMKSRWFGLLNKFTRPVVLTPQEILAKRLGDEAKLGGAMTNAVTRGVQQGLNDFMKSVESGRLIDENVIATCMETAGAFAKRTLLLVRDAGARAALPEATQLEEAAAIARSLAAKGIEEMRVSLKLPQPAPAVARTAVASRQVEGMTGRLNLPVPPSVVSEPTIKLATAFEIQAADSGTRNAIYHFYETFNGRNGPELLADCLKSAEAGARHKMELTYEALGTAIGEAETAGLERVAAAARFLAEKTIKAMKKDLVAN